MRKNQEGQTITEQQFYICKLFMWTVYITSIHLLCLIDGCLIPVETLYSVIDIKFPINCIEKPHDYQEL